MTYDKDYYANNAQNKDRPALWFYSRIWRTYCKIGPVLEFGCGVGFFSKRLSRYAETYGLDINPYALERFKVNAPQAHFVENLINIPTGSLGSIASLHVLEHIPDSDLRDIGSEFNRILKPGGRLLIVVPDLDGSAAHIAGENWMGYRDSTHINLKGAAAWHAWFENEWNLKVVKSAADGYYAFPYGKSFIQRLFGDATKLCRTAVQFLIGRLFLRAGDGEAIIFILEKK